MRLALHDALANQRRHGATVLLTLRCGPQFMGQIKPPPEGSTYHDQTDVLLQTPDGGWQTIEIAELAAVGVRP